MTRFTEDRFTASYISTIGVDFRIKKMDIEMRYEKDHPLMHAVEEGIIEREEALKRKVKLQIWDTAG